MRLATLDSHCRGSADAHALDRVDLEVRDGEFIALLGPSGCGKSTLMRPVAGLVPATTGRIASAGTKVDGPHTGFGIVFQAASLLEWRTVLGNVLLQLELRGLDPRALEASAIARLKAVGLDCAFVSGPHRDMPTHARAALARRARKAVRPHGGRGGGAARRSTGRRRAARGTLAQCLAELGRHLMAVARYNPPHEIAVRFIAAPPRVATAGATPGCSIRRKAAVARRSTSRRTTSISRSCWPGTR